METMNIFTNSSTDGSSEKFQTNSKFYGNGEINSTNSKIFDNDENIFMDFNGLNGLPYLSNIDVTLTIFTEKTGFTQFSTRIY